MQDGFCIGGNQSLYTSGVIYCAIEMIHTLGLACIRQKLVFLTHNACLLKGMFEWDVQQSSLCKKRWIKSVRSK